MYLQRRQRALLKALSLTGFCLLITAVSKTASQEIGPTRAINDGDLAVSDSYLEKISVTGKVLGIKASKDQKGIVLLLEGSQGFQFSAYLSQDVEHVPLRLGDRVEVKGSSGAKGTIAVTTADGVKLLKKAAHPRTVHSVEIRNGVGRWQAGNFVAKAATALPDGHYPQLELIDDAYGRKVLE